MGTILAKLPQQRIRAPEKHPTIEKLEQLFDYMDELGLILTCEWDVIHISDKDRPQDKKWEIRDVVNSDFLTQLPCRTDEYKLTKQADIFPREAQPAPNTPVVLTTKASGLNHFKTVKIKAKKKKISPPSIIPKVFTAVSDFIDAPSFVRGKK